MNAPEMSLSTDVAILGKGISGLVLSHLLQKQGIPHLLLSRKEKERGIAWGETLPPTTMGLLQKLGLYELFVSCANKTHGYHSIWGSNEVTTTDFFNHPPFQHGLKLNKALLIEKLEEAIKANIVEGQLLKISSVNEKHLLAINKGDETINIEANTLVEATGRSRYLLKQLGIGTQEYDGIVAAAVHLPVQQPGGLVHKVFTETFEAGWGIVSQLNDSVNVMTLYTDKDEPVLEALRHYKHWPAVLASTQKLKDFLTASPLSKVVGAQANSSKATQLAGNNWLAIGDAAIAFDPLSSHGISNALYGASKAAEALGRPDLSQALKDYENTLVTIFEQYLVHRQRLYASERRWKSDFWAINSQLPSKIA